jgi:hypothetical protein
MDITLTLDADLLHETLIALRNRRHNLTADLAKGQSRIIDSITQRQLYRLDGAIMGIENALQEIV